MKKSRVIQVYPDGSLVMPRAHTSDQPVMDSELRSTPPRWWRMMLLTFISVLALVSIAAVYFVPLEWALMIEGWTPLLLIALVLQCFRILFELAQYSATTADKKRRMEFGKVAIGIMMLYAAISTSVNNFRIWILQPIKHVDCEFNVFLWPLLRHQKLSTEDIEDRSFLFVKDTENPIQGSLNLVSVTALTVEDKNIYLTEEDKAKGFRADDIVAMRLVFNGNQSSFDNRLRFISAKQFLKDKYYLRIPLELPPQIRFRCTYSISINNGKPVLNADPTFRDLTVRIGETFLDVPLNDNHRIGKEL